MPSSNPDNKPIDTEIENLVKRAQEGETEAFSAVYEKFVTPIYRYIYYRVPITEVEDLTEVVFLKAFENIRKYRLWQSAFTAWLFRIARNVVIDYYRITRPNGELPEEFPDERREANSQGLAERMFDQKHLRKALSKLKENYRQIILLKYISGLSNREISIILRKSESSIRIMQFRALRVLRHTLKEMGIES